MIQKVNKINGSLSNFIITATIVNYEEIMNNNFLNFNFEHMGRQTK